MRVGDGALRRPVCESYVQLADEDEQRAILDHLDRVRQRE
jgi:hypothetical protein